MSRERKFERIAATDSQGKPFDALELSVEGDTLKLDVEYEVLGGETEFVLCWDGRRATSLPPHIPLIVHYLPSDNVRTGTIIRRTVSFDLTRLTSGEPPKLDGKAILDIWGDKSRTEADKSWNVEYNPG